MDDLGKGAALSHLLLEDVDKLLKIDLAAPVRIRLLHHHAKLRRSHRRVMASAAVSAGGERGKRRVWTARDVHER